MLEEDEGEIIYKVGKYTMASLAVIFLAPILILHDITQTWDIYSTLYAWLGCVVSEGLLFGFLGDRIEQVFQKFFLIRFKRRTK